MVRVVAFLLFHYMPAGLAPRMGSAVKRSAQERPVAAAVVLRQRQEAIAAFAEFGVFLGHLVCYGDAAAAASLVLVYDMTERAEEGVLQGVLGTTGCCCCCRQKRGSETKPESLRGMWWRC
ncbi:unnamed protein product [Sphagnum compactum]